MASNSRRIIFNALERLLSTDFNAEIQLADANLDTGLVQVAVGTSAAASGYGSAALVSGVVDGLVVSPANPGVDLTVAVSQGLAYKVGTAPTTLDSTRRRIEARSTLTLDLAAYVDGGNPRWVAIEISPGDTVTLSELRDVFQPALGTFVSTLVDKIRAPLPVLSVTAGAAAAKPILPDGVTGVLPLAYVRLGAAATSIAATDIILCRPLYSLLRGGSGSAQVHGGGVNVTTAGSSVVPRVQRGVWSGGGTYALSGASTWDLSATSSYWASGEDWASLAGANRVVYGYACRAPYPTGYDADVLVASREFSNFTSHVGGAKGGEPLVIWTTGAPSSSGPYGSRSLTSGDGFWGSGGTVPSQGAHLIGAVTYLTSLPNLTPQVVHGDRVVFPAPTGLDVVSTSASGATVATDFDVRAAGGGATATPTRTTNYQVKLACDQTAITVIADYRLLDQTRLTATTFPVWQGTLETSAATTFELWDSTWLYVDAAGANPTARIVETSGVGSATMGVYLAGYQDPTLAAR